jgi:hypothetical protein
MAWKDQLSKWLNDQGSGPERKKLAERLLKEADDEETASLLNRMLDEMTKDERK